NHCFCCGEKNEKGLQLIYSYPEKGSAETELKIPNYFTGWGSLTHGGFLAMLLDETMAHACVSAKILSVTAELNLRYLRPVEVGESIKVRGEIGEIKSRIVETQGWIYNSNGEVAVKGKARFLKS
ncbi:unnamed protein product, partial [marine sediment metagenome]